MVVYSCGSTDTSSLNDSDPPSNITIYDLSAKLNASTWKITFFSNNGIEETNLYSSYVFKFNKSQQDYNLDSGIIDVIYQTNNYKGNWSVYEKIISYNPTLDTVEFGYFVNLSLVSPNDILKINGEWQSVLETNTKIELKKEYNGEIISRLFFEKN